MGKASVNKANIKPVSKTTAHEPASNISSPAFSNGELGQLQEILFGQQQRSTHEQIDTLKIELSEQIRTLNEELNSRLNQLAETVKKSHTQFEQQLEKIKKDGQSDADNLRQSVRLTTAELQTNITALAESTDEDTKRLALEIAEHESKILKVLTDTKSDLQTDITRSLSGIHNTKLDKQDLAHLLSEVSEKLAGNKSSN